MVAWGLRVEPRQLLSVGDAAGDVEVHATGIHDAVEQLSPAAHALLLGVAHEGLDLVAGHQRHRAVTGRAAACEGVTHVSTTHEAGLDFTWGWDRRPSGASRGCCRRTCSGARVAAHASNCCSP